MKAERKTREADDDLPITLVPLDRELLRKHCVYVKTDSPFQQRARLLQALWREDHDLPIGLRSPKKSDEQLGSRLAMPEASATLTNFLTPTIRRRARRETLAPDRDQNRMIAAPRIFCDLLSSQPLAFNLFAELDDDRDLATKVFRSLLPDVVDEVDHIEFEYSPGRRDSRFLANRSAFDVFVVHTTPKGGWGFVGIEVKYHENLNVKPANLDGKPYEKVARRSKAFSLDDLASLKEPPLQQIWLDHLLALSMLNSTDEWETGKFVVISPALNTDCNDVLRRYQGLLQDDSTFGALTLEQLSATITKHTKAQWIREFADRYLDFARLDSVL